MNGVTQTSRAKGLLSFSLTTAVIALLALTGCKEEPKAAPPPAAAANSNAALFAPSAKAPAQPQGQAADMPSAQSQKTGPGAASGLPSLIPGLDPAVQKECQDLKSREKKLRDDAETYRNKEVAPASSAAETAYEAFANCQMNFNCTNNETQYTRLGKAVNQTQATMERLEGKLMILEGELHDVSQKISRNCGDF